MLLLIFSRLIFLLTPQTIQNPDCGQLPRLNASVFAFVKEKVNKKVGRGECWDLAAQALDQAGAEWDHDLKFGRPLKSDGSECIFPGDIIQFEGVKLEYRNGNSIYTEQLDHHTAVVYEVKGKQSFLIAQQNTGAHGRKVSIDPLDLRSVKKGRFTFYRPIR